MFTRKKNLIIFLMVFMMALQPVMTAGMTVAAQVGSNDKTAERHVKIAIISDIHYVIDQQRSQTGEEAMHYSALTESRMEQEISTILDTALEQAAGENPDVLLACGDLLSNGEFAGGEALAEKLKAAKSMEGLQQTGIYVVNGNHDINNSYSSDFSKEQYWNAKRVQPEDFREIFNGLGYGAEDSYDHHADRRSTYTPPEGEPAGSLSYVTEIAEGITLIVLDTGIYSGDADEHYGAAQQTAGQISDNLLNWAVEKAGEAKDKGNLVLAMCHHGVIPHYSDEVDPEDVDWFMSSFIIADWESRARALADAGVTAVLTGHTHASDIAKYISPDGNVLYDIETAALCAYPTAWRTLTITIDGTGKDKTYSFSVDTHFIDKDFGGKEEKTADWKIMYGENEGKTFADYEGSMQEYGKEKSRYHQDTLRPMIDYMLRVYLYDFLKSNGSLENYLVQLLGGSETDSLKDVLTPLVPLIPVFVSLDQTFEYDSYRLPFRPLPLNPLIRAQN